MNQPSRLEHGRGPHGRALASSRPVPTAIGALMLAMASAPAAARDDADANGAARNGGFCTTTARLLYAACGAEARDDQFVGLAKCVNIGDAEERAECQAEVRDGWTESSKTCREQLEARRTACGVLGEARYDPDFEADRFDADFRRLSNPNPYFPLGIGNRWEYLGGDERNTVEIVNQTKLIEGVTCVVYRDLVYKEGRLVEATDDWFAAGRDGSSWYCGEEVKDYESFAGDRPRRPELVSTDGSFKHGRDYDKAGLIMPAHPRVGQVYQEEFSLGNAEDVSEILSVNYSFGANTGLDHAVPRDLALRLCNRDCVVTKNYSLLEPGSFALKYYARGIGFFLETKPEDGEAVQLVGCNFDQRCAALPRP